MGWGSLFRGGRRPTKGWGEGGESQIGSQQSQPFTGVTFSAKGMSRKSDTGSMSAIQIVSVTEPFTDVTFSKVTPGKVRSFFQEPHPVSLFLKVTPGKERVPKG